ncbi:MAG: DUF1565 domain-containing protein [Planctomycetota bacterium]|nr:DUF1565 domain-containing protein [Planctomycetota bacterium]MDA1112681.1 DUF1565 domain-containing protein [Planctomycetota bacterium]
MNLRLLSILFVFACASSLSAQTTFFVDPVGGSDGADGSQATPFESLTFAMTQATAGDTVTLLAGTYSTVNETFPILLVPALQSKSALP